MLLLGTVITRLVGKLDRERTVGKGGASLSDPTRASGLTNTSTAGRETPRRAPICELEKAPAEAGAVVSQEDTNRPVGPEKAGRLDGAAAPRSSDADNRRGLPPEKGICRRQVMRTCGP